MLLDLFLFAFINFLNSNSNYFTYYRIFNRNRIVFTIHGNNRYFLHYKSKFFRVNDCNNSTSIVSNYNVLYIIIMKYFDMLRDNRKTSRGRDQ